MVNGIAKRLARGAQKSVWSATFKPAHAIIFLTYRCTSMCAGCNIWQRPVNIEDELTWEQWEPILRKLADSGTRSIEMFGGDALLRKDLLFKMIRFCTDNNISTFFPTNSSSLTKDTAEKLVDAGLGTIYFSLDEVPEIGESVRGTKRHFDRVTKSIALFKKIRGTQKSPRLSCITTVSSLNFRYIETLLGVSHEAGADEHMLRGISEFTNEAIESSAVNGIHPSPYFMPTDSKSHAFRREEAEELLSILNDVRKRKSDFRPMSVDITNLLNLGVEHLTDLTYPDQQCVFATTNVVISPYGNVLPCLYYKNYHLGNLVNDQLDDVWGNDGHREFCSQQKKNRIPLCEHCSIKFYHKTFVPAANEVVADLVWRARN